MPVIWNDSERCAEIAIEDLEICLFGAQDVLVDATFRCWGMTESAIDVLLGPSKFFLDRRCERQNYIRRMAIGELLSNSRYAERVADADDMIDAADHGPHRRDVGYGHQYSELF
jgi:hypothetical protein